MSHDSGYDPVHWEEVEMIFYPGGREKEDFNPIDPEMFPDTNVGN